MGRPRSKSERTTDRRKVNRLRHMGYTQQEIADKIGRSQGTVSRDFAFLDKLWKEATLAEAIKARGEQLAEYQALKHIYYVAWEESRETTTMTVDRDAKGNPIPAKMVTKKGPGNTVYLLGVERMRAKIDQFWGNDAPFKIAPTDPSGQSEYAGGLTDETKLALITALVERARERISDTDIEQQDTSVDTCS